MYSLDKYTGETRWNLRLPGHPSCTPEIDANQVYVGMTDGSVYAYSLRMIRQLFGERKLPGIICGPGRLAQCHVADEYIDTEQLLLAAKVYGQMLVDWCR